jgi:hypothetical protein
MSTAIYRLQYSIVDDTDLEFHGMYNLTFPYRTT